MKKLALVLAAMMFGSVFADVTLPTDKSKFLIVVLSGQSNMAGRGYLDDESTNAHPRVVKLTKDFQWVPCVDPIHFDKGEAGAGIGKKFAELLADANPDCMVGVVPTAVGGTGMYSWQPGCTQVLWNGEIQDLYGNLTNRTFFALQSGKLAAILWHQGESDCSRGSGYLYQVRFPIFLETLRRDLGEENRCPFIAGSLFLDNALGFFGSAQCNCQIEWCSNREGPGGFAMARSTYTRNPDNIHFTTETARDFGIRYYEAYSNVVEHLKIDQNYWKTNVWTDAMKRELLATCGLDVSDVKTTIKEVPPDQIRQVPFEKVTPTIADFIFPKGIPYVPQHDDQTATVSFDSATGTLSFFCDAFDHGGDGVTVYTNVSITSSRTWKDIAGQVTKVVFDASFAAYRPYTLREWFSGCKNLVTIEGIENLNTSETIDMGSMFNGCSSLASLDVTGFDTSAVQDFGSMFNGCTSLEALDVSGFRTTRSNSFAKMFYNCSKLAGTLDVTHFSCARLKDMTSMFSGCKPATLQVSASSDFVGHELIGTCGWTFTSSVPSVSKTGVRVMAK